MPVIQQPVTQGIVGGSCIYMAGMSFAAPMQKTLSLKAHGHYWFEPLYSFISIRNLGV